MVHHCFRTAFWTLVVLHQHVDVTDEDLETTWVAALLHDIGLEDPPAKGDFSLGGVQVLRAHGERGSTGATSRPTTRARRS